jgi:predicted short-subunit dehydrogenase-like oxidoreductase (DUF2520 family)
MKTDSFQKIVFIGAGNVATSLSEALKGKNNIIQVYSKTIGNARKLGEKIGCSPDDSVGTGFTNDLKKISTDADLYIIAVKDDALEDVCKKLKLPGKIVIHTSGSTEMNVLKTISNNHGVIWPMYSFTTGNRLKPFPNDVPFFTEASDKKTEKCITELVKELKGNPYYINSEKRAKIHMTAVFVNNFPNHLFTIAEALCKDAGVPFSLFLPLAKETVDNISKQSPALSQTGPANRNEKRILKKHLALLKSHPMYKEVYEVLTKSIISQRDASAKSNSGRKKF